MRILLIGASGQLGSDILRNNDIHDITAPNRAALDLANPEQVTEAIRALRPDAVINCAAFHDVLLCEKEPEQAFRINCVAVRNLALLCEEIGAWLVTFSSDYVFGGDKRSLYLEDDRPAPLQIYGITRVAGEFAALAAAPHRAVIVRTCGLYGRTGSRSRGGNFVDKRVEDARKNQVIEVSSDQTISPTSTDDLSRAVLSLIAHPELRPGIYHLVNEGTCTWYELTRATVELLGLKTEVRPVDRGGRDGSMRRPLYSALANTRARALGIVLRPWQEALAGYLREKYSKAFEGQNPSASR
jgi:dTDP-4-dehydrorhamnose reductase